MDLTVGTKLIIPEVPPEQIHGTCKVRPQILKAKI
jgi:hypothetical protein